MYLTLNAFPQLLFSHVCGVFMMSLAETVARGFTVGKGVTRWLTEHCGKVNSMPSYGEDLWLMFCLQTILVLTLLVIFLTPIR
jgi:hypothetical protein